MDKVIEKLLDLLKKLVDVWPAFLSYLYGKKTEKLKNERKNNRNLKKLNEARRRLNSDPEYTGKLRRKFRDKR